MTHFITVIQQDLSILLVICMELVFVFQNFNGYDYFMMENCNSIQEIWIEKSIAMYWQKI